MLPKEEEEVEEQQEEVEEEGEEDRHGVNSPYLSQLPQTAAAFTP
jgi:hypothetical protein